MRQRIHSWDSLVRFLGFSRKRNRGRKGQHPQRFAVRPQFEPLEERQMMSISVGTLQLLRDTGSSATDLTTADATLVGQLTGTAEVALARVEFDHDGDSIADAEVLADLQGAFDYTPSHLPYGSLTLRARALEWNDELFEYQTGNWTSLSFVFVEEPPVTVSSLIL